MVIREIEDKDIPSVLEIYNWYIAHTTYTLEYDELSLSDFSKRVHSIQEKYPFLVLEENEKILGYAYLSFYNEREGYHKTVDLSIYLRHGEEHQGYGALLFNPILKIAIKSGYTNMISIITEENETSVRWHLKMGFEEVGRFHKASEKFNRSLDVIFLQKHLSE